MWSVGDAAAACDPAAADNVTAVCTGDTVNQGPAVDSGYGLFALTNLNVTVVPSATVTGSLIGILFNSGNVTNSGIISGGGSGILTGSTAIVTNSGTIAATGADGVGIFAGSTANVTNSGTIAATGINGFGIFANVNAAVTNSGTIAGGSGGIFGFDAATVINSGTIAATGVNSIGISGNIAIVTNSGTIEATGVNGIGISTVANADVTNSGTISGGDRGIASNNTANVINFGTVAGGNYGVYATDTTVTNSGRIVSGGNGVHAASFATVTNSGSISGGSLGIYGANLATVTNVGSIAGDDIGISSGTGNITTSGTIIGGSGTAIAFNFAGSSDTLTVLPGARFGGLVNFNGGADNVNFGPGNWILNTANFDAGLSTISTSGNPYWVTPNRIVVANVSSFGAVNRAMLDITGWISSVLPDNPVFEPATNIAAHAFAAIEQASPRANEAFSNFPSALPYAPTPVFKGGAVQDAAGNAFWAKGFGGRREQDTTDNLFGSVTKGYGGAVGYTHRFNAAFQLGGFAGGSTNKTDMDFNLGSVEIDTTFGGVHARTLFGAAFLDLSFIGGNLDNSSKRNIGGGMNLETASADYGGWFVNPAATLGYRFAVANGVTLMPALKVRYLKSQFDDYVETGSSVNLAVSGWESAVWEERAELTLASVQYYGGDNRILFRMTGGALAQQRQGDSDVGLTFAGQSLVALAPDQRRVNGWYGSAGFDWQRGQFAVFASGEITDTSDSAVTYAGKGGLRMVW